jgi:hypothetical protein
MEDIQFWLDKIDELITWCDNENTVCFLEGVYDTIKSKGFITDRQAEVIEEIEDRGL